MVEGAEVHVYNQGVRWRVGRYDFYWNIAA